MVLALFYPIKRIFVLLTVSLFLFKCTTAQSRRIMENNSDFQMDTSEVNKLVNLDSIRQHALLKYDSAVEVVSGIQQQKDMGEWIHSVFNKQKDTVIYSEKPDTDMHFSVLPGAGYTLQTGFAVVLGINLSYSNDTAWNTKISRITSSFTYTQYNQTILPFQADLWTKGNRWNYITDLRYMNYPSPIYGLGGKTDPNIGYTINFSQIRIHQSVLKSVSKNLYAGLGYFYDHFYNIQVVDSLAHKVERRIAHELGTTETASGIAFRVMYDSRLNQINPLQGFYSSVTFRTSEKALGSDSNWQSIQIDTRAYFRFPRNSGNVLAFWMFDWLTTHGTPPYLLLPSTGWDDNYNTGRGYIQGRFRGKDMYYFETEYRFGLTRNGLLGGVVFANVEHFSGDISSQYTKLYPGYGMGIRLKLNKYDRTNLCIDYGFGSNGSHGFFVNLGEVF